MKRPSRFRPALEQLEDRWCPTYLWNINGGAYMSPAATNVVNGALGVVDNDVNPHLKIVFDGGGQWEIDDLATAPDTAPQPVAIFTGVTTLSVTMGGTGFDTLLIDGNFTGVGFSHPIGNNVSVALDGMATNPAMPNTFTFQDAYLNNNNNPANSTLFVLGQGHNNTVRIGPGGGSFTDAVQVNITYRDPADGPFATQFLNDGTNITTSNTFFGNGLSLSSQSNGGNLVTPSPTDKVVLGSSAPIPGVDPNTGGFFDYGNANLSFGPNNPFTLNLGGGSAGNPSFIGSANLPNASFTVTGGRTSNPGTAVSPTVNLGDGNPFIIQTGTTTIDLDDKSGSAANGTINVNPNLTLKSGSVERFDDYGTINIGTGAGTVTLGKPLTIWDSTGGSTVTIGSAGATINGDIIFDSGVIAGDSDEGTIDPGTVNTVTVASGATLAGNLTANLNTTTDTVDVEGTIGSVSSNKTLTVNGSNGTDTVLVGQTTAATINGSVLLNMGNANFDTVVIGTAGGATARITGNSTINEGSGGNDILTINQTATFNRNLVIGLGSNSSPSVFVNGRIGAGPATATVLTVTSGSGASVSVIIGEQAVITGSAKLNLSQSASNFVIYEAGASISGFLFANAPTTPGTSNIDRDGHANVILTGSWNFLDDGDGSP